MEHAVGAFSSNTVAGIVTEPCVREGSPDVRASVHRNRPEDQRNHSMAYGDSSNCTTPRVRRRSDARTRQSAQVPTAAAAHPLQRQWYARRNRCPGNRLLPLSGKAQIRSWFARTPRSNRLPVAMHDHGVIGEVCSRRMNQLPLMSAVPMRSDSSFAGWGYSMT